MPIVIAVKSDTVNSIVQCELESETMNTKPSPLVDTAKSAHEALQKSVALLEGEDTIELSLATAMGLIMEWEDAMTKPAQVERPLSSNEWWVARRIAKRAIQWTGENVAQIDGFAGDKATVKAEGGRRALVIETLEGTMLANINDWIIRGIHGEFYPCKPDIFEATYEPLAAEPALLPQDISKTTDSRTVGYCLACGHSCCIHAAIHITTTGESHQPRSETIKENK
jgi:hypothetical protein